MTAATTGSTGFNRPVQEWNTSTVHGNGMKFLVQQKEQLDLYRNLWEIAKLGSHYSADSVEASNKFKAVALSSKQEISKLNIKATQLLEAAEDLNSEKTKELVKIVEASRTGLVYLTAVINDTMYSKSLLDPIGIINPLFSHPASTIFGLLPVYVGVNSFYDVTHWYNGELKSMVALGGIMGVVIGAIGLVWLQQNREYNMHNLSTLFRKSIDKLN